MNLHERFVLFVSMWLQVEDTSNALKAGWLKEAAGLNHLNANLQNWDPLLGAYEFVRFKMTGANRPAWLP